MLNKSILKVFSVVVMLMMTGNVWGFNNTNFFAKVNVSADPTGAGKVYVGTSANPTTEGSLTGSKSVSATSTETHVTFYVNAVANPGYTFQNWTGDNNVEFDNDDASSAATQIQAYTTSSDQKSPTVTNMVAHFTPNQYTVTFDAETNGGTVDAEPIIVTFDAAYGTLPVASKEDYDFSGWYTEIEGGTRVDAASPVKVPSDHTLYAQFTEKTNVEVMWEWNAYHEIYTYGSTINNILTLNVGEMSLISFESDDEEIAKVVDGNLVIGKKGGTAHITVRSQATAKYLEKVEVFDVTPVFVGRTLPLTINSAESFAKYVVYKSHNQNAWENSYINLGPDNGVNWDDRYVDIAFEGVPDRLSFTATTSTTISSNHDWRIFESADGVEFGTETWKSTDREVSCDIQLKETTRYVRLYYSGNYRGRVYGFTITEKPVSNLAFVTVSVSPEAKYGTFCAPIDVEMPSGVTAYTCDAFESDGLTLSLTEVEDNIVKANTAVILYAPAGLQSTEFYGEKVENETGDIVTTGLLTGVYVATQAPKGSLVLQNHDGVVGFYTVDDVQPTVPANRCYLNEAAAGARFVGFGGETAIQTLQTETTVEGRKYVDGKNIVIVKNGKKFNVAGQRVK